MNDNGDVVSGNDWTSMFGDVVGTLTNAFTSVKDATQASPSGAIKPQQPNPSPGLFGPYPQTQVNNTGNAGTLFGALGLPAVATGGMGGLLLIGALLYFLLRR